MQKLSGGRDLSPPRGNRGAGRRCRALEGPEAGERRNVFFGRRGEPPVTRRMSIGSRENGANASISADAMVRTSEIEAGGRKEKKSVFHRADVCRNFILDWKELDVSSSLASDLSAVGGPRLGLVCSARFFADLCSPAAAAVPSLFPRLMPVSPP